MFLINIQMFVNYKSLYFVFVGVCFFCRFPSTLCPCLEWTDADSQTNRRFCFAAFRRILRQILFFQYVSNAKIIVSRYCYYEVVWQFGRQILISSFFWNPLGPYLTPSLPRWDWRKTGCQENPMTKNRNNLAKLWR